MKISGANMNTMAMTRITTVISDSTTKVNNDAIKEIVDTVTLSDQGKQLSDLKSREAGTEANVIAISESIAAAVQA